MTFDFEYVINVVANSDESRISVGERGGDL